MKTATGGEYNNHHQLFKKWPILQDKSKCDSGGLFERCEHTSTDRDVLTHIPGIIMRFRVFWHHTPSSRWSSQGWSDLTCVQMPLLLSHNHLEVLSAASVVLPMALLFSPTTTARLCLGGLIKTRTASGFRNRDSVCSGNFSCRSRSTNSCQSLAGRRSAGGLFGGIWLLSSSDSHQDISH